MRDIYANPVDFVVEAYEMAHVAHLGQWRKGSGAPYMIHPLKVGERVGLWGISKERFPNVWAECFLHDGVEDTSLTLGAIEVRLNREVASVVGELTFRNKRNDETAASYSAAKAEYMASFVGKSVSALVVKIADRLCNVEDFLCEDETYAIKYWDKAKVLFDTFIARRDDIVRIFGQTVLDAMAKDYGMLRLRIEGCRSLT